MTLFFTIGIQCQEWRVRAIDVELQHKMTPNMFDEMIALIDDTNDQFVSDVNTGDLGSLAFHNVELKRLALSNSLPDALVTMDIDYEHYGATTIRIKSPTLVIMLSDSSHNGEIFLKNDFHTRLYHYIVDTSYVFT